LQLYLLLMNIEITESKITGEEVSTSGTVSIDASKVKSSVLQRLIEEVKYEDRNNIGAYNRLHNRHNRSR
jgi:hypothetical protein